MSLSRQNSSIYICRIEVKGEMNEIRNSSTGGPEAEVGDRCDTTSRARDVCLYLEKKYIRV